MVLSTTSGSLIELDIMIRFTVIAVILFTSSVLCDPNGSKPDTPKTTDPRQGEYKLTDCPFARYKKTMEGYLVNSDPTEFFQGTFVDYYVAPARGPTCDTTTYTLGENSQVTSVSMETFENRRSRIDCEERQSKINDRGLYFIQGTFHGDKDGNPYEEQYDGKLYVFYADHNVIAYYFCEYLKEDLVKLMTKGVGDAYNAVVSVKQDKMNGLLGGRDRDVKGSVDKAIDKMKKITNEVEKMFVGRVEDEEYFNPPFAVANPVFVDNKHLTC